LTESENIKKRGRPSKVEKSIKEGNQKKLSDFFKDEKKISLEEIIIGERKRSQYSKDKIDELAQSIQEVGLMNPIVITEDKILVAGYHRILAFKKLGRLEIPYRMTTLKDPLRLELQEIDENLVRGELIPLEICEQLYRRKQIYEDLNPKTKKNEIYKLQSRDFKGQFTDNDNLSSVKKAFSEEIADKMSISQRTIQRRIRIARDVIEELREIIRDTKIAHRFSELEKISKLSEIEQRNLISVIDNMKRDNLEIEKLNQIRGKQLLYKKEAEKRRTDPIEDLLMRKIIKYEGQIKNFLYSGKGGKIPYDLWLELTSTNDKRWEKGKCYTYNYCHFKKLNFDVISGEELNLNNFTLHHQKYIFKNMLTKQAFPINAYSHRKGRIPELEGREWALFRGGFINEIKEKDPSKNKKEV
jgi:ParB family chromosome partitioning protein